MDIYHIYSHPVFLQRCCSFTLRKLFVCLETFLCFFHQFDRAYVSRPPCIGPFSFVHSNNNNNSNNDNDNDNNNNNNNNIFYNQTLLKNKTRMLHVYGKRKKIKTKFVQE